MKIYDFSSRCTTNNSYTFSAENVGEKCKKLFTQIFSWKMTVKCEKGYTTNLKKAANGVKETI
jgi:hypothetical protein